jgi:hypothetical protein
VAWNIRTSRVFTPDLEILMHQVNVDVAPSIVLDASTFTADSNGDLTILAGQPLKKLPNNMYGPWATADGTTNPIRGILARTERVPDALSHSDIPSAMWNHGQWFRADRIVGWAADQAAIKAALPTCKFDVAA